MDDRFKDLVDVCGGRMTLKQVCSEIDHYVHYKRPKRLIVDIQKEGNEYRVTFWMSEKDFLRRGYE